MTISQTGDTNDQAADRQPSAQPTEDRNAANTATANEIAENDQDSDALQDNYSQNDEPSQAHTVADEAIAAMRMRSDAAGAAVGAADGQSTRAAKEAEQRGYGAAPGNRAAGAGSSDEAPPEGK